jgi:predicted 2-oxoglutarate/Fe(II)-dependent dioxygenase YbiX
MLNCTRKLNILIFLSKPEDYEGGQVSFNLAELTGIPDIIQEQGSMVIFPSYLPHCVKKVTKGLRYSLSAMIHGDSFR